MVKTFPTKEQLQAIKHFKGPALVIAGPGAGKTAVLTERVKWLITKKNVNPARILVTTFTEKAANELKVKLAKALEKKAGLVHIGTIHSFCSDMLSEFYKFSEGNPNFEILDETAQRLLIEVNKRGLGLSKKNERLESLMRNPWKPFIPQVIHFFSEMSTNNISPKQLQDELKKEGHLTPVASELIKSYMTYREKLRELNLVDYDILQEELYGLLKNESVRGRIRSKFDFILVDEYQDTSPIQDAIFRKIANDEKNIFVVGDEDQSIYGFRGATNKNFTNFQKRFPGTTVYTLFTNFRSTEDIVELSNKMTISSNKKLNAFRDRGEKAVVITGETIKDAAEETINAIIQLKKDKLITEYGDVALLFRSVKSIDEYLYFLKKNKIPYVVFRDGQFMARPEIRSILYLLNYIAQDETQKQIYGNWGWWRPSLFLNEVVGLTKDAKKVLDSLEQNVVLFGLSKDELIKMGFNEKDAAVLESLNNLRTEVREKYVKKKFTRYRTLDLFYRIMDLTGYLMRLTNKTIPDYEEKLGNLGLLTQILGKFDRMYYKPDIQNLQYFMMSVDKERTFSQKAVDHINKIKIMTVHQAKGLEFPVVFVCDLMEQRFPLRYRHNELVEIPNNLKFEFNRITEEEHYAEEHRLFYVAITRARDHLFLTKSNRITTQRRQPSRFLEEIADLTEEYTPRKMHISKPAERTKKISGLSYSAINTFIDCPFRYDLVYNYDFETPETYTQKLGTFLHNALAKIHLQMKEGLELSKNDVLTICRECWIPQSNDDEKDERQFYKYSKNILEYYNTYKDTMQVISVEEPFNYIGDNFVVRGRVDLIAKLNGKTVLVDFKSRKLEAIGKTNVEQQLRMYGLCLKDKYSLDELRAYAILENKFGDPISQNYDEMASLLKNMDKQIEDDDYKPKYESAFCKNCVFARSCGKK